ncbi:MAG: glycoside hydrolase family 88 protein [Marinilabiliaceae bacterium]|nr:glycoside hydrolase family 88 protein [Marinilabiliaceae bacterium]
MKTFFCNSIKFLIVLILVNSLPACGKLNNNKPYSIQMAHSEMERSPKLWMIGGSTRLKWNYYHSLFGKAFLDLHQLYGNVDYYNYVRQYADTMIFDDGQIYGYNKDEFSLDRIANGNILTRLIKINDNDRYRKAAAKLNEQLIEHPRTKEGAFWHKKIYPNQIWVDEFYMGILFYGNYAALVNDSIAFNDIFKQYKLAKKYLYDSKTGLYKHGWDESRAEKWANPNTGQSSQVWGRGLGWFAMSLVDILDVFPSDHAGRVELQNMFVDLMESIVEYQDAESGVWFQIVDKPNIGKNYLESSCSCMFTYCLLKGLRMNYLKNNYQEKALFAYKGLINEFIKHNNDGNITISNGCLVGGLGGKPYRDGSFSYYVNEPYCNNDAKAVASFIMASVEFEKKYHY